MVALVLCAALTVVDGQFWRRRGSNNCPPENYAPAGNFSIDAYIAAPWYVYSQMPNSYQPKEDLFCVVASYEQVAPNKLNVRNYANTGAVNGPSKGTSGDDSSFVLQGTIPNADQPSKLLVHPSFLPAWKPLAGDYWVVATGPSYEWAVITAGPPNSSGEGDTCYNGCDWKRGCFGSFLSNGEGMWLFTRDPIPADEIVAEAESEMGALGLDVSKLAKVAHEGCKYDGAF